MQDNELVSLKHELSNLKTEYRALKKVAGETSKRFGVFEALKDEIAKAVTPIAPLPSSKPWKRSGKNLIEEHLVMHLSDEHADQVVKKHQTGGLESYNFRVALARAEKYVSTTLKFTQETLSNYRFPVLHILSYGDHSSGEIHGSVQRSYFRNQFRNSLAIGQMQALMFRDLAPHFEHVNILCLPGNHGRRGPKKDYYGAWDNWDYLISEIAATHCRDIENISFNIPDAFSANVDILGHGFGVCHGDDIKSWNSIPWYGLERRSRRLMALNSCQGRRVRNFVYGHFHKPAMVDEFDGETLVNGPWIGTDPYVYESLSGYTMPSQLIHGVHEKHGISWRLKVRLKERGEKPVRYAVVLAKP